MRAELLPLRRPSERGFSFLEVLIAMAVLLLGAVAILSLFAVGVADLMRRQVDSRLDQVRTEVSTMAQAAVDRVAPGEIPAAIPPRSEDPPVPLSQPGFGVRLEFARSELGPGLMASAWIYYQGRPARTLPPIPLTRSTLDPR